MSNNSHPKFAELLSKKPTIYWREQLDEDLADEDMDDNEIKYTHNLLNKADALLEDFAAQLSNLKTPAKSNVLEVVKDFVLKLNDLTRDNSFIETGEREDLCDFIDQAVTIAGLELDPEEDISFEWRKW